MSSTVDFMFAKTSVFAIFPSSPLVSSREWTRASNLSVSVTSTKLCSTLVLTEPTLPTAIHRYPGSRKSRAMSCISRGNVAENMVVWRSSSPVPGGGMPCSSMIFRICGSKPMSSILSASSRVKRLTFSIVSSPRSRKSSSRPGVQMAMSHPSARSLSCCPAGAPPYTETARTRVLKHIRFASLSICWQSSRVGARMTLVGATGPSSISRGSSCRIVFTMGTRKAAVLPLPVWALHMTSLPIIAAGRLYFCTGVGLSYPQRSRFSVSSCGRPNFSQSSLKVSIGSSVPWPPMVSTGMLSYLSKLMPMLTCADLKSRLSS
mmetsp:Transcript_142218/g.442196  ORF Transcript_142218/g.442196 Transcript_142218/m.442196 type:complete len:319 (-) Transcript_142218:250-1206(-)